MEEKRKNFENRVAQILEGKNGKPYLKFTQDVTFEAGDTCWVNDFQEGIKSAVERGNLSEERAAEILEKQHFVLFNVERAKKLT